MQCFSYINLLTHFKLNQKLSWLQTIIKNDSLKYLAKPKEVVKTGNEGVNRGTGEKSFFYRLLIKCTTTYSNKNVFLKICKHIKFK